MIVAFLQNPWFPVTTDPEIIEAYRTNQEFHRHLLSTTMSGQRLLIAFGGYWYNRIWWDNANPKHVDDPHKLIEADVAHMERVVLEKKPYLILVFGNQAIRGIRSSIAVVKIKIMGCHHPNARHHCQAELDQFAQDAVAWAINYEREHNFK